MAKPTQKMDLTEDDVEALEIGRKGQKEKRHGDLSKSSAAALAARMHFYRCLKGDVYRHRQAEPGDADYDKPYCAWSQEERSDFIWEQPAHKKWLEKAQAILDLPEAKEIAEAGE